MSENSDSIPCDRRDFAKRLSTGAVAASLARSAILIDAHAAEPAAKTDDSKNPGPPTPEDLYLALVRQIDPEHLRPEHLAGIRGDIASYLARSKRLSSFPLTNADEPAPVYSAWRAED